MSENSAATTRTRSVPRIGAICVVTGNGIAGSGIVKESVNWYEIVGLLLAEVTCMNGAATSITSKKIEDRRNTRLLKRASNNLNNPPTRKLSVCELVLDSLVRFFIRRLDAQRSEA